MATFKANVKTGVDWIIESVELIKISPNKWMVLALPYVMLFMILPLYILELTYITTLILPVFVVVLMMTFRNIDRKQTQSIKEMMREFQLKIPLLILLGGASLLYVLLMDYLLSNDIQALLDMKKGDGDMTQSQLIAYLDKMMPLLLQTVLLKVPLVMATWFSPMLIAANSYKVVKAVKSSIAGSLKYMVALGAAWTTLTLGMMIVLALLGSVFGLIAKLVPSLAVFLAIPVLITCMTVAAGLMLAFQYVSYRDIFRAA
jgi:hypothetical protein